MKNVNLFKNLFLIALLCAGGFVKAQIHPLSFGSYSLGGGSTNPNWYADYVGLRLEVVSPSVIAGDKAYVAANSAALTTAGTGWGGIVTAPLVNLPIFMDSTADSFGCSAFSAAAIATMSMTPTIAVIWRGPEGSGACDFSCKALYAQDAGAAAVIIINEYADQGPVGMALGTCTGITIPVFMVGNLDGIAMSAQYRAGIPVHITITPWGQNLGNDLGFVPNGEALWHTNVIPANQMVESPPFAYNMLDGAFIANYGTNPAYGVKLKTTTSFTPAGSSTPTVQHTDSVTSESIFYDDGSHPTSDSIMAFFNTAPYPITATGGAGGQFNVTYVISDDSVDQYPGDNTQTVSFYLSDTVFCKGSYDFTTNWPIWNDYLTFGTTLPEFLWGPMYYVSTTDTSTSFAGVQFSLAMANGAAGYPYLQSSTTGLAYNNVYVFKWVDGLVGGTPDSIVEAGELVMVAQGTMNYVGFDTTTAPLYTNLTDSSGVGEFVPTPGWYYVCIDIPDGLYLGVDGGSLDPYPRVYAFYNAYTSGDGNHYFDYSGCDFLGVTDFPEDSLSYYPSNASAPVPSGQTGYVTSVDSFIYSNMEGLIPNVALTLNNNYVKPSKVNTVPSPLANVTLYPNPAKDVLNASVSFSQNEPVVSYEIIDGLARFVSKEIHHNVQNDVYTINTTNLVPGNYYLIINAEGKVMSKQFTILK